MKIGILSDTHDQYHNIRTAVKILNKEHVKLVIHCGDWISPFTHAFYRDLKCPMKGVFGNNDGDRFYHLKYANKSGISITFEERILSLTIDKRKIVAYHGDYPEATDALITCGKYDAVFHGHTHISVNTMIGNTLSLNPGTLMPVTSASIQGASIAIYNTKTNTAENRDLSS